MQGGVGEWLSVYASQSTWLSPVEFRLTFRMTSSIEDDTPLETIWPAYLIKAP